MVDEGELDVIVPTFVCWYLVVILIYIWDAVTTGQRMLKALKEGDRVESLQSINVSGLKRRFKGDKLRLCNVKV